MRAGLRRGLLGGSRPWIVVGGVALGLRALGRLAAHEPEVVFCERLSPGETLVISRDRQARPVRVP